MTKYLETERFVVTSNTKEALQKYADNYDRTFGEERVGAGPNVVVVEEGFDEALEKLMSAPESDPCSGSQPRIEDCPSNECEIRNTCTGHLNCPRRK